MIRQFVMWSKRFGLRMHYVLLSSAFLMIFFVGVFIPTALIKYGGLLFHNTSYGQLLYFSLLPVCCAFAGALLFQLPSLCAAAYKA
jgi:hypothetical protein